jgi:N-acetylglutamate synthase-like GNAT family acetyltransferase
LKTIFYRQLSPADIPDSLLDNFTRYQKTTQVLALVNGDLVQKEDSFIDDWDPQKLKEVTTYLRDCAKRGGVIVGAFMEEKCIGFTSIEPDTFGSDKQYAELTYCHITREIRGNGIGRELFHQTCTFAKNQDIKKLYLSTHPSIESQGFYASVGCVLAEEINPVILAREPLDIQLEKHL